MWVASRRFLLALSLAGVAISQGTAVLAQKQPAAAPGAPQHQNVSQTPDRAYAAYLEALRRDEEARTRAASKSR